MTAPAAKSPPTSANPSPLSQAQLRQWEQEGYLLVRNLIDPANIAAVRDQYAHTVDGQLAKLKAEGKIQDEGKSLPFETRFARAAGPHANSLGRGWRRQIIGPAVYHLHHDPKLLAALGQLLGPEIVAHPVFNARPKLPGQKLTTVPWHQDAAYFGRASEPSHIVTVWIPLVPVTAENGCLQVIPGSHKGGWIDHVVETGEGKFLEVPGQVPGQEQAVTCPMNPGDALLFTHLTLHRSLDNLSDIVRWSIDIRFLRDGDEAGRNGWKDPTFKWAVRSATQPLPTVDQWMAVATQLDW